MTEPEPPVATTSQRIAQIALAAILAALGLWTLWEFLPALAWAAILAIAIWPYYHRVRTRFPPSRRTP